MELKIVGNVLHYSDMPVAVFTSGHTSAIDVRNCIDLLTDFITHMNKENLTLEDMFDLRIEIEDLENKIERLEADITTAQDANEQHQDEIMRLDGVLSSIENTAKEQRGDKRSF